MDVEYRDQPVKNLQYMLRRIGFRDNRITSIIPDNIYGERTMRAVSDFQRTRGLPVTGVANQRTVEAITEEFGIVKENETVRNYPLFGDWRLAVEKDIYHPHIFVIQAFTKSLREVFPTIPDVDFTGKNDDKTTRAIQWYQNRAGLAEDGVFDKFVWEVLTALYYVYLTRNENYLPRP